MSENEVSRGIGLGPEALAALAPFHLVWDSGLRVLQVGDVLGRMVPELLGGCLLTDCFVIRRPRGAQTFEDLARVAQEGRTGGRLTMLESVADERLTLRGQLDLRRTIRASAKKVAVFGIGRERRMLEHGFRYGPAIRGDESPFGHAQWSPNSSSSTSTSPNRSCSSLPMMCTSTISPGFRPAASPS